LDLREYVKWSDEEVSYVMSKSREVMTKLLRFPIPTVAVVDGAAIAGGADLALACDFRYGTSKCSFAFPETRLGLISSFAAARLPEVVGLGRSKDLVFTGRSIQSDEALRIGLLDFCGDDAEEKAHSLAEKMVYAAPLALRGSKKAMEKPADVSDLLRMLVAREDRKEGVQALLQKRLPKYKGN